MHHFVAHDWFESLDSDVHFCFCRFTQLGLLRLLTAEGVMGDEAMTQTAAWTIYDQWLQDNRVSFVDEPSGLDRIFRKFTRSRQAAPKAWADSYLAAFADASQMTLVTLDRAFRRRLSSLILLEDA